MKECDLAIEFSCVIADVGNTFNAGKDCEAPDIGISPCKARPTGATMLFNGGGCEQSDNRQLLQFTCEDFEGGPPVNEGDEAYVIVSDIKGRSIIYFEGIVRVGEEFPLYDDGNNFVTDQAVTVYTPDQGTLLQSVQYHSSCSSNLELKNRFGSVQLVSFFNGIQGNVTCFETFSLMINVVLPIDVRGDSATFQSMTAQTNFAGFLDLTDQVVGTVVQPGGSVAVMLQGALDLTQRREYTAVFSVTAITNPTGEICEGMSFDSFTAGNPLPEGFPTSSPTKTPTLSPAPTLDSLSTACDMTAEIVCDTLKNGRAFEDCSRIPDPRGITCSGGNAPTHLSFNYTGSEPVTISVDGKKETTTYNVTPGEIFEMVGSYTETAKITIEGGEYIEINTQCGADSGLTLGESFGPLLFVGFKNGDGVFTAIYPIVLTYKIRNGPYAATLDSALITSAFASAPIDAMPGMEYDMARGEVVDAYREMHTVNALDKYEQGVPFDFKIEATARGAKSNLECSAETTYTF